MAISSFDAAEKWAEDQQVQQKKADASRALRGLQKSIYGMAGDIKMDAARVGDTCQSNILNQLNNARSALADASVWGSLTKKEKDAVKAYIYALRLTFIDQFTGLDMDAIVQEMESSIRSLDVVRSQIQTLHDMLQEV